MMVDGNPVLVVGSAALDTLHTPSGTEEDILGGSSFYFSTAGSLFTPIRLVAVVGTDFPREEIAFLNDRSVDLSGLEVAEGETFRWGGRYENDPNVRETLFTTLGVFQDFDPKIPDHFRETPFVFLGNIHPSLQLKVLDQISTPRLVVLDTMNFWIQGTPDELATAIGRADVLIINDEEAAELTGRVNVYDAADDLLERGLSGLVVKKGQHGAVLFRPGQSPFFVPAYPVRNVVDPTGAGDSFAGGFIGHLANADLESEQAWRDAIVSGTVVASTVVEDFSLRRLKTVDRTELEDRRRKLREMTRF